MAITTIASGLAPPLNNPLADPVVDLAVTPLPNVPDVQLYGYAADSNDPNAVFSWSWAIVGAPVGTAAVLDNAALQDPKLQGVDIWGNYRLMLVATNNATLEASEVDPLLAPTASFVTVRVRSVSRSIQKPASGERNWHDDLHEWAQALEDMGPGLGAHAIPAHTDILVAIGQDLDVLCGGGYANASPNSNNPSPLHKHGGGDVDPATIAALGTVILEDAPLVPLAPKVITRERLEYTAESNSWLNGDTMAAGVSVGVWAAAIQPGALHDPPCLVWHLKEDCELESWAVALVNGGMFQVGTNIPEEYKFELFQGTLLELEAAQLTTTGSQIGKVTTLENGPLAIESGAGLGVVIPAGNYVALICIKAPGVYGGMLTATLHVERPI